MASTLSIIGGGSSYSPVLIRSLIDHFGNFPFNRIVLMDIQPDRLDIVTKFLRFQFERYRINTQVDSCQDLPFALQDVDVVITLYRVGGLDCRRFDITQATKHGILGQETQGWGGFASALRNIPVAHQISKLLEELSPTAWLINATNPVGIVTQACNTVRLERTLGICEIPTRMHIAIAEALGLRTTDIELAYVGLNHLSWVTDVSTKGIPIIDKIFEGPIEKIMNSCLKPNIPNTVSLLNMAKALRAIPSPYLCYYYLTDELISRIQSESRKREDIVMEIDGSLMRRYAQCDDAEWLRLAAQRGGFLLGSTVAALVEQILVSTGKLLIPCLPNRNTLPFLSPNAVIETPIRMRTDSCEGQPIEDMNSLHPHIRGLVSQVAAYEELTVAAGVSGDYNMALSALATHPLIPSLRVAQELLDETLMIHREFLPQFA